MRKISIAVLAMVACSSALATPPPDAMHYQGVLRDALGNPLSGNFDMVFRFFDVEDGEIAADAHVGGNAVTVTGGLFEVWLGGTDSGLTDGPGPGTYTSVRDVFRDYGDVHVEIQVGAEVLSPRVRVGSVGYAFTADSAVNASNATNAASLDGLAAGDFLRSDVADTASGAITFRAEPTGSDVSQGSLYVNPPAATTDETLLGAAVAGRDVFRVDAEGDVSAHSLFVSGGAPIGIDVSAADGAWFRADNGLAMARLAFGAEGGSEIGVWGMGRFAAGYFPQDGGSGSSTYLGLRDAAGGVLGAVGIDASGKIGGRFSGYPPQGFPATSNALVAADGIGIEASGDAQGGHFWDRNGTGEADIAVGNIGIAAWGSSIGGYFYDSDGSGNTRVGFDHTGVDASGNDFGIRASAKSIGGYFEDLDGTGEARCGYGDVGVHGWGDAYGLQGFGQTAGVYGRDRTTFTFGELANNTSTVTGNGTKDFVQNHPYDPGRAIHYSAPEGDEVATYTRGTAQLVNGVARVQLGETFQWVTNPDLGLTAHLTPRGARFVGLTVESLSTTELVVIGPAGSDAGFDYIVYGLRIGFEEVPVVRQRGELDARIPSMGEHREALASAPQLRAFTAFERFRAMPREKAELDLRASHALLQAIGKFGAEDVVEREPVPAREPPPAAPPAREAPGQHAAGGIGLDETPRTPPAAARDAGTRRPDADARRPGRTGATAQPVAVVTVTESVETGDVLAIDPDAPGRLRRAREARDPALVGIVVEGVFVEPEAASGEPAADEAVTDATATLAVAGIVTCNVDAGYGEIRAGDLLTTSPTPGRAMRADDAPPGTILGKALEGLAVGSGSIRVLVMQR